ncbi:MAG TPA: threo-3-hydroxy-L-aspartate ammonia-lyase [Ignavibacteriaceae bacterium]|nr:threo-3-hydroxy-L-aspartate ammonia-lyase [Ignavibacteriaceae bacterium]
MGSAETAPVTDLNSNQELFDKIKSAAETLKGVANVTPVMSSRTLNKITWAKVFLKCENFQRIGAFKFRGAYNAISNLNEERKSKGVITYSSGNHAQAVALASRLLNVKATIVMPSNAPGVKKEATKDLGANVVEYNPENEIREEVAKKIQGEEGSTLIPPFDHEDVIAGQGTAAYEFIKEVNRLEYLLVPCGGGGLLSGSAVAIKNILPSCKVIGIEPELADDAAKSFQTKVLHTVKNPPTIADGTRTSSLGRITFPLILKYVDDIKTVSEKAIIEAVRFLFFRMKLVVEPSGALGIAALLSGAVKTQGRVGVIISGGNIDPETINLILNSSRENHEA